MEYAVKSGTSPGHQQPWCWLCFFSPYTAGNVVRSQHWSYWCSSAKASDQKCLLCWINTHSIGPVSYRNITFLGNSIESKIKFWNKLPSWLRVAVFQVNFNNPGCIGRWCVIIHNATTPFSKQFNSQRVNHITYHAMIPHLILQTVMWLHHMICI